MGSNHFSKLDDIEQYRHGMRLFYYDQPAFFTHIPGPYHNLILYGLITITKSVLSIYLFMVLLGVLTIYLQYKLIEKIFSSYESWWLLGLCSSLMIAIMPWTVKFSVSYWNPNFIIPLTTLLLGYLYDFLYHKKSQSVIGIMITVSLMPFFHMIVLFIIPLIIILFIDKVSGKNYLGLCNKNALCFNPKYFLAGFMLTILIYIPFLLLDYRNNFYIIGSYLSKHTNLWSLKPETLKIISNPLIVSSNEISRFIGHSFEEYNIFIKQIFGSFIFGFSVILLSLVLFIYSFILFIKQKNIIPGVKFFLIWFFGTGITHTLSLQVHEERYTVIWIPMLYTVIPFAVTQILSPVMKEIDKFSLFIIKLSKLLNIKQLIVISLFIITLLTALYLNVTHYYYERNPNYGNETRLTSSLIFYENIKKALVLDYFSNENYDKNFVLNKNNFILTLLHDYSKRDMDTMLLNHSFHSFLGNTEKKNAIFKRRKTILPLYFLSSEFLTKINYNRQLSILNTIKVFCNFNMNLINDEKEKSKYTIYFIDKDLYASKFIPEYYLKATIIGTLPDSYIVKSKIK